MGAKIIYLSNNYRKISIKLPVRWYGKNMHGTLFGGFICALSDPIAVLLCQKIFPDTQSWTRKNEVEFFRPVRSKLQLDFEITETQVKEISRLLVEKGECLYTFEYSYKDKRSHLVAHTKNTIYLRKKLSKT